MQERELEDANKGKGREEDEKWKQTKEISEHTTAKVREVGGGKNRDKVLLKRSE